MMNEKYYYNVHTHIFDFESVPNTVLGKKMSKAVALLKKLPFWSLRLVSYILIPFQKSLGFDRKTTKRMVAYGKIIKKGRQRAALQNLIKAYSFMDRKVKFVVLPMNFEHQGVPSRDSYNNYIIQVDGVLNLMEEEFKELIFPFMPIDPRSFSSGAELIKFVEKCRNKWGLKGIKIYPALGFYLDDEKLVELFRSDVINNFPIMVHAEKGPIFYRGDLSTYIHSGKYIKDSKIKESQFLHKFFQVNFLNFQAFEKKVLKKRPDLKICFAHMGGHIKDRPLSMLSWPANKRNNYKYAEKIQSEWYKTIINLCETYENVYTDVAFVLIYEKMIAEILNYISNPNQNTNYRLEDKIMFGTDYFVNIFKKDEEKIARRFFTVLNKFTDNKVKEKFLSSNATRYLS